MKLRAIWLFVFIVAVAACGGAADEPVADTAAPEPVADAPMDDAAALDARTEYFVTHYNMHHADMVAELYADDAVVLGADGSVRDGKAAVLEGLEAAMASNPTVSVEVADRVISGDWAVTHGSWDMEATPEGAPAPLATAGHFFNVSRKIGGEWKTSWNITNYDADPPEGVPYAEGMGEEPAELTGSPLAEVAEYYATHYNMGHGDMVASRYAEDGMAAFANMPAAMGRAAIAERLNTRIDEGDSPQLTIHEVGAQDIGDGWVIGGGWYEVASSAGDIQGGYMMLCRTGADGNMEIVWAVSNAQPAPQ